MLLLRHVVQAREVTFGDARKRPLIDAASTCGRNLEPIEVNGHAAWGRHFLLEQVDETTRVLDVRGDERLLGASCGKLEPQVLLRAPTQMPADETDRSQRRYEPPIELPAGAVPVANQLRIELHSAEGDECAAAHDLGLFTTQIHNLEVAVDRLVEWHPGSEHRHQIDRLFRMRSATRFARGRFCQLEAPTQIRRKPLEPDRKVRRHVRFG